MKFSLLLNCVSIIGASAWTQYPSNDYLGQEITARNPSYDEELSYYSKRDLLEDEDYYESVLNIRSLVEDLYADLIRRGGKSDRDGKIDRDDLRKSVLKKNTNTAQARQYERVDYTKQSVSQMEKAFKKADQHDAMAKELGKHIANNHG